MMKVEFDEVKLINDLTHDELRELLPLSNNVESDPRDPDDPCFTHDIGSQFRANINSVLFADPEYGYRPWYDAYRVFRARRQGKVIGVSHVEVRRPHKNADAGFYVLKDFRRHGVGTQLMQRVKSWLKENVAEVTHMMVHPWSHGGNAFFKKAGGSATLGSEDPFHTHYRIEIF